MKAKPVCSKEFQSKLAAYSATATAALLAAPAAADAVGIQNITSITPTGTISWSANNPFNAAQNFTAGPFQGTMHELVETGSRHFDQAALDPGSGCGIIGNGNGSVRLFGLGAAIHAATSEDGNLLARRSNGNPAGAFQPAANGAVTGYIGFEAKSNQHTYYGWLRVKVDGDANGFPDEISLIAASGDPDIYGAFGLASSDITAGEIASPVPEPSLAALGGLGLLALGARGVREMRRRKTPAAPV